MKILIDFRYFKIINWCCYHTTRVLGPDKPHFWPSTISTTLYFYSGLLPLTFDLRGVLGFHPQLWERTPPAGANQETHVFWTSTKWPDSSSQNNGQFRILGSSRQCLDTGRRLWEVSVGKCAGCTKDKSGHYCQAAAHVPRPTPLFDIGHNGVSDCCHRWLIFQLTSDRGQSCLYNLFQHWDVAVAASEHR